MENYLFTGTASETIAFDPAVDTLEFGFAANQVASVAGTDDTVTISLLSGVALTLTGVSLSDLAGIEIALPGGGFFAILDGDDAIASDTVTGVAGGEGANQIALGDADNYVLGGGAVGAPGDLGDTIVTGSGADTILGNGGDDNINAGSGNDLVYGGAGSDVIVAAPGAGEITTIYGGGSTEGTDTDADFISLSGEGSAAVYGSGGDDIILAETAGDNTVYGGNGSDFILVGAEGSEGNNLVYGGASGTGAAGGGLSGDEDALLRIALALNVDPTSLVVDVDATVLEALDLGIDLGLDLGIAEDGSIVDLDLPISLTVDQLTTGLTGLELSDEDLFDLGLLDLDGVLTNVGTVLDLTNVLSIVPSLLTDDLLAALTAELAGSPVPPSASALLTALANVDLDILQEAGLTAVGDVVLQIGDGLVDADVGAVLEALSPDQLASLAADLDVTVLGDELFDALDTETLTGLLLDLPTTALETLGIGLLNGQLIDLDLLEGIDLTTLLGSVGTAIGDLLGGIDLDDLIGGTNERLVGTDVIGVASDGDNTVFGGTGIDDADDGDDVIAVAGNGDNLIYGNGGDDYIIVEGTGSNTIHGGAGDDIIELNGLEEDDLGSGASVLITGGAGSDEIFATVGGDVTVYGGIDQTDPTDGADDIFVAATGSAEVYGGGGDDQIFVTNVERPVPLAVEDEAAVAAAATPGFVVSGGAGSDEISALVDGDLTVFGGDVLSDPTDQADLIQVLATGTATVYANGGDDFVQVTAADATVHGGFGGDYIVAGMGTEESGNYTLFGGQNTASNIVPALLALGGLDIFSTPAAAGTYGIDVLQVASDGDNTVYGGLLVADPTDGADAISVSGGGDNLVYGNGGSDYILVGGEGSNTVYGGLGDDIMAINGGLEATETLAVGGAGSDLISVSTDGDATIFGGDGISDPLDSADVIQATVGGSAAIYGNGGADTITLLMSGEASEASVYGGAGDDRITVSGSGDLIVFGGEGSDGIDLSGFAGDATVYGGVAEADPTDGADLIVLGSGDAVVYGNGGNDTIVAGAGDTTIYGGAGADSLVGGEGADRFVFSADASGLTLGTMDTITDFDGASDVLNFGLASGTSFNFSAAAVAATSFEAALTAASTAFSAEDGPSLYSFQTVGSDGFLFVDYDQNGVADQAIRLSGVTTLDAENLV